MALHFLPIPAVRCSFREFGIRSVLLRRHLSPRRIAILALVATTLLWGTSFVAAKVVLENIPPFTLGFFRFAIALTLLVPLLRRRGGRPIRGRSAALLGLTGMALFFLCQNLGLRFTGAADATLINNGAFPVVTGILAVAMLGERLTPRLLSGLVVSLAGVAAVALPGGSLTFSVIGDGLILLSVVCGAAYVVLGRRYFAEGDWLGTLVGAMSYGLLFLLPATVIEIATIGVTMPDLPTLLLLLYLGLGCSALAFALWAYAIKHLVAAQIAVVGNLEVPIGIVASVLLLGERLTPVLVAGGALVFVGAWLATDHAPDLDGGADMVVGKPATG